MTDAQQLAEFAPFTRLDDEQRGRIALLSADVVLPAGARLFEEGQLASGCWLIRSGRVVLETVVPGRGPVVVQTLGAGDVLGCSWLVLPQAWNFAAVAAGTVEVVELDTAQLRRLADDEPALGYPLALGLLEVVVARLQNTRARLLDVYRSPREH